MRNCLQKVGSVLTLATVATMATAARHGQQIDTRMETQTDRIPAGFRYEFSRTVRPGGLLKSQTGHDGFDKRTYRVELRDGKPVGKELIKEEREEAQPTLYLMSRAGWQTSRGGFNRGHVLHMVATAYPAMVTGSGRTRLGYRADYGHVAVDPRVIPLGSLVYVEGYGFALASDTGSAIKGNRIDLCYPDWGTADRYGVKKVTVHVFNR